MKRSMLERHGWSAPWLPGLWKLPNGDLFDVQNSQTSLLISLQLCFEKGLCISAHSIAITLVASCSYTIHETFSALSSTTENSIGAEKDVQWKCPKAQSTLEWIEKQRRIRTPGHVRIADRGQRETVFEVPGRSHATDRSIPSIDIWSHFIDDRPSLTWEKVWTDPYDTENRKVIQVLLPLTHDAAVQRFSLQSCCSGP